MHYDNFWKLNIKQILFLITVFLNLNEYGFFYFEIQDIILSLKWYIVC